MAAVLTSGITLLTGDTVDGNGGSAANKNLNDLVNDATIANVGSGNGEIAAAAIESGATYGGVTGTAATSTPALRKLGTGANDAAAGNDSRLTDARTANALKFGSNSAINLSSTNPTTGQILYYDGTNISAQTSGVSAWVTGNGTADSVNAGSDTTVTADTAGAFGIVQVGWLIRLNGSNSLVGKVTSKTDSSTITLGAINLGTNNNVSWEYQIGSQIRPWNSIESKGNPDSPITLTSSNQGSLYKIDTSAGNVAITLAAASTFGANTLAFKKVSDDANTITITRAGSDTIDGSTSIVLSLLNSHVTLVGDGTSRWNIVSSSGVGQATGGSGTPSVVTTLQKLRVTSSTLTTITAKLPSSGNLTDTPASTDGTEVLTNSNALQVTPTAINSKIRVRAIIYGGLSDAGASVSVALFKTVSAVTTLCTVVGHGGGQGASKTIFPITLDYEYTSGSTSQITFALRVGVTNATYRLNGLGDTTTAPYGGNIISFIEATELSA